MINYSVCKIESKIGKEFIKKHHYSKGIHNAPTCYGLFDNQELIGVLALANPCSEAVRESIFGKEHKSHITELHRLAVVDGTPKNTESYFISRALKLHKLSRPDIWAIISFADSTQGHVGTIYQATNALFCGTTGKATFYLDKDGRLRHPRQNGVNISLKKANEFGWSPVKREGKYRYVFILPDNKKHKKQLMNMFKLAIYNYPKKLSTDSI